MSSVKIELRPDQVDKIHSICDSLDNREGELINVLHKCQSTFGYLPAEVQEVIAEKMMIPAAKVYGVVTFYSFFTMIPKGKYPISICTGTACYVRGAETVLAEFKKELDIEVGKPAEMATFRFPVCDVWVPVDLPPWYWLGIRPMVVLPRTM